MTAPDLIGASRHFPGSRLRRLGWVLDRVDAAVDRDTLAGHLEGQSDGRPTVLLDPRGARRGPTDKRWGLVINTEVEPDLLLARTIIAIYEHSLLKEELVFRGGTCLHQVHLSAPLRYSEDLDFVRTTHTPIGPVIDALREVAQEVGLNVAQVAVGMYPKVKFRAPAASGGPDLRIKVEINTYETSPARPLIDLPFAVESSWFSGACSLQTFTAAELVSTKLRALYQRSKGRDAFDLWLGLDQLGLDPAEIVACFEPYRPSGYTSALAVTNLQDKLKSPDFLGDLSLLVANPPANYDIAVAAARIEKELLSQV